MQNQKPPYVSDLNKGGTDRWRMQLPNLLSAIGNTPLVGLDVGIDAHVMAKLEYLNPGGSIKDRSALYMIERAEQVGLLKAGGTIVEASSGNQGIALAMIGAIKGYRVIITVPERTSSAKVATLRAYGAQVQVCKDVCGDAEPDDCHSVAVRMTAEIEGSFMPNQYFNAWNSQAHYLSTGPEIWRQTDGQLTHLFVGAGSCGTITGVGRYLKEQNPNIKIIGVDAENSAYSREFPLPYKNEGLGIDHPHEGLFDASVIDQIIPVSDQASFDRSRWLAKNKGFLVGPSSGGVIDALIGYASQLKPSDYVVAMCADSGRAYLDKVFNQ